MNNAIPTYRAVTIYRANFTNFTELTKNLPKLTDFTDQAYRNLPWLFTVFTKAALPTLPASPAVVAKEAPRTTRPAAAAQARPSFRRLLPHHGRRIWAASPALTAPAAPPLTSKPSFHVFRKARSGGALAMASVHLFQRFLLSAPQARWCEALCSSRASQVLHCALRKPKSAKQPRDVGKVDGNLVS